MRTLNIDPEFTPLGEGIEVNFFDFPSGCEPHCKLRIEKYMPVLITLRPSKLDDVFKLLLVCDALKRKGIKDISLIISYLPFARQDRVMVEGEPLSVKVIADIINSCRFNAVGIFDPHSEVCLALINNSYAITNHKFVRECLLEKSNYLIVSPDAGAYKKIFKLCQYLQYKEQIVLCNKLRDVSTGNIIETTCDTSDFHGKDLYIIDDICDGGGTFILLAKELRKRNAGKINLIVSHGIFSKGNALDGIDNIYTTDSFKNSQPNKITLNDRLLS